MTQSEKPQSTNTYLRLIAIFLGFITTVLFIFILFSLKSILIPFTIAIFLTFVFDPLLRYIMRFKVPKHLAIFLLFILVFGSIYLIGWIITTSLSEMPARMPEYGAKLTGYLQDILGTFGMSMQEFQKMIGLSQDGNVAQDIGKSLYESGWFKNSFTSISSFVGDLVIVITFWLFMIAGKHAFEKKFLLAFDEKGKAVRATLLQITEETQKYISAKTFLNTANAAVSFVIMISFGIDYAFLWTFMLFVFNYIPNIGPILSTVPPILMALMQYGLGIQSLGMAGLLFLVQFAEGNYFEPKIMGSRMDLSPVYVLFSLIFWGWVWGIAGAFLAVPIAVVVKILFENITPLKPLAVFLGSYKDSKRVAKHKTPEEKTEGKK